MDACSALWRRLDTPGHDTAFLMQTDNGWSLRGTAVFKHAEGSACVTYSVDLDPCWSTRSGMISGFIGTRKIEHRIRRESIGWYLDDRLIDGLTHLVDLDYGFTPATNLQQLRRLALEIGQAADLDIVWFDIDACTLTELPQHYERRSETTYWYTAPSVPYEGLLEISPSGFVRRYPGLWRMES